MLVRGPQHARASPRWPDLQIDRERGRIVHSDRRRTDHSDHSARHVVRRPGVERFPEIRFESTRVSAIDHESSQIFGNLTMHGITQEVKLDAVISGTDEDPWGNTRAGLEAVAYIMRSDFDMKFNQALGSGNLLVGDKVTMSLDISAIRQT